MKVIKKHPTARISEIFSSIQGEGIYAGQPHIFVRFYGCNMNCIYCDTPCENEPTEITLRSVVDRILELSKGDSVRTISLTGGEPLLYASFIKVLAPYLKDKGHKFHLDTNGTLPDNLKEIIDLVDVVAMDIKPPSATNERPLWDEHRKFLNVAKSKDIFIKVVITGETTESDFHIAVDLIESIDRNIPFILQPAWPFRNFKAVPDISTINRWQKSAASKLKYVRVIPQMHKIWGVK